MARNLIVVALIFIAIVGMVSAEGSTASPVSSPAASPKATASAPDTGAASPESEMSSPPAPTGEGEEAPVSEAPLAEDDTPTGAPVADSGSALTVSATASAVIAAAGFFF